MRRDGGRPPSDRNRGRGNPPRKEVKDLIKTATMTMISISISISTTMKMITIISILKWQQPCAVSTHQSVSPLPHHCHGLAPQLHQNQNHHPQVIILMVVKLMMHSLFVCFVSYMHCIIGAIWSKNLKLHGDQFSLGFLLVDVSLATNSY